MFHPGILVKHGSIDASAENHDSTLLDWSKCFVLSKRERHLGLWPTHCRHALAVFQPEKAVSYIPTYFAMKTSNSQEETFDCIFGFSSPICCDSELTPSLDVTIVFFHNLTQQLCGHQENSVAGFFLICTGIVYLIVSHWAWSTQGWLNQGVNIMYEGEEITVQYQVCTLLHSNHNSTRLNCQSTLAFHPFMF